MIRLFVSSGDWKTLMLPDTDMGEFSHERDILRSWYHWPCGRPLTALFIFEYRVY